MKEGSVALQSPSLEDWCRQHGFCTQTKLRFRLSCCASCMVLLVRSDERYVRPGKLFCETVRGLCAKGTQLYGPFNSISGKVTNENRCSCFPSIIEQRCLSSRCRSLPSNIPEPSKECPSVCTGWMPVAGRTLGGKHQSNKKC